MTSSALPPSRCHRDLPASKRTLPDDAGLGGGVCCFLDHLEEFVIGLDAADGLAVEEDRRGTGDADRAGPRDGQLASVMFSSSRRAMRA